uniref:(California timema) hypothetical protein n=1 Tax=Timema californicum TaxID=61474 RepID=A0A7R9PFU2_TIMCA|nr:unnamed protein product [Timema californicum]
MRAMALRGRESCNAFNNDLILQTLKDILAGNKCEIPVYDYVTNSRVDNQLITIYPADVVLLEGILVFYFPEIRELFHMKLFVDTDSDTRLARRGECAALSAMIHPCLAYQSENTSLMMTIDSFTNTDICGQCRALDTPLPSLASAPPDSP